MKVVKYIFYVLPICMQSDGIPYCVSSRLKQLHFAVQTHRHTTQIAQFAKFTLFEGILVVQLQNICRTAYTLKAYHKS